MQSWRLSSTQLPLSWSPLGLNILSPSARWRGRWRFGVNVWEEGIRSAAALTSRPVPWSGNDWSRKVCMFLCASVFRLAQESVFLLCVSVLYLMAVTVHFIFPKGAPEVGPGLNLCLWFTVKRRRILSRTHRYQICRIHTPIHKHDLLVIPVSSFFFAFLSAVASDVLGLLSVWETAAKGPLAFFSTALFLFFLFSLPTSFMLLSVNPAIFQTMQMFHSPLTFLWHFSRLCVCVCVCVCVCGGGGGGGAGWLAVRKLTSVISSTQQRMLTPASTVKWAVLKRCQPHGVSLLF